MSIFVQATGHNINMHAKIQYLILHRFLYFFKIWVIRILYNAIMHNIESGQIHCKDFLKRNPKKFILYFYEICFIYSKF
jgi:hypothetical protein